MQRASVWILAAVAAAWACGSDPATRQAMQIPAVSNLRLAVSSLMDEVERTQEPPEWMSHARTQDGRLYGIGMQGEQTTPEQDLYLAMVDARRSVSNGLERLGVRVAAPQGLVPPLAIDASGIGFERLAHDTVHRQWYALARFDLRAEATRAAQQVDSLNQRLALESASVAAAGTAATARVRSALAVLYALDRRAQWRTLHSLLARELGDPEPPGIPEELQTTPLRDQAREVLSAQSVRVLIDGPEIPGLLETVAGVLSEVSMQADDFGSGLVALRFDEIHSASRDWFYAQLDGELQLALEGPGASARAVPLHAVGSGDSETEAHSRAVRRLHEEVRRILREELAGLGA